MFNRRKHLDENSLLGFCEGELRASEASRAARHLDACWECRTRVDDVRKTIGEYVHYRKDVLQPSLPAPPAPWMDLNREFQRIGAQQQDIARKDRVSRWPMSWILLSGAVLLASTTMFLSRTEHKQVEDERPVPKAPPPSSLPAIRERAPEMPITRVTADDELRVIAALHRMRADLGDPIDVVRERDRILVNSTGLDPARADQLRASLDGIPRVSVQLSAGPVPPSNADSRAPVVESVQESRLEPQISQALGGGLAAQKIVDEILRSSEAMLARAHALRALADRFPTAVADQMSPSSLALLASIREEHITALANDVAAIEASMNPILKASRANGQVREQAATAANWQELTYELFASAATVDRLLGVLLAPGSGAPVADSAISDLSTALNKLNLDVNSYQRGAR